MNAPDFYDVNNSLGFMSITVNRLLGALFRRRLAASGIDLTGEQWGVLAHIWIRDGMTQEELARILCLDKSSLSRALSLMEARGLVERGKSDADARHKLVYATPRAGALRRKARETALAVQELALEGIPPEEVAVAFAVLERVKGNIIRSQ